MFKLVAGFEIQACLDSFELKTLGVLQRPFEALVN